MPNITIPIYHKIGQREALKRAKAFTDKIPIILLSNISNLKINWNGNNSEFSFSFANILIKGNLLVENDFISIKSKIPFIFLPLKGQIEKSIRQHAMDILK